MVQDKSVLLLAVEDVVRTLSAMIDLREHLIEGPELEEFEDSRGGVGP